MSGLAQAPIGTNVAPAVSRRKWRESGLLWVLAGRAALLGANTLLLLFLAHAMPVASYGLFVVLIGAQLLLSRFLLLGIDSSLIRFFTLDDLRLKSDHLFHAGLSVIFRIWLVLLGPSAILAAAMPRFTREPDATGAILAVVFGSLGLALVDYCYARWLSALSYHGAALAQGGTAVARAAFTCAIFICFPDRPVLVFLTYAGVSVVSGLAQMFVFTRGGWTLDSALMWRLIRYSGWQAAANIFAMINLNQGSFELGFFKGKSAAGVFAVGLTLSLSLFAVYNAFFAYALPHAVRLTSRSELNSFLARFMLLAVLLASSCIPLVWVAGKIAPFFFPTENGAAITAFDYLAGSVLLALIQAPLEALSQRLLQPRLILVCWLARVVFSGSLGIVLIVSAHTAAQAAVRAGVAQFAGAVPALILLAVLVFYALRAATRTQGEFACAA